MVPSLARMSVIIKSQHETSVMTGNYEMAYICGLLCRLTGTVPPSLETPVQLQEDMMKLSSGGQESLQYRQHQYDQRPLDADRRSH